MTFPTELDMNDICDTFDQLRADIAAAQRRMYLIDEQVSEAIEREHLAGEPFDLSLSEQQQAATAHLDDLLKEFALLEMMLNGELG